MNHDLTKSVKGTILEIQRMSTEDGPGIRTTIFFKGCSLKCEWCHNPESISAQPQIHWIANRCIGCRTCMEVCPQAALALTSEGMTIRREVCTGCGLCAEECPSTALELLGRQWGVQALIGEVIKDEAYFDKSGGGVTLGGGEPTLQPQFALKLLKGLKQHGVQTALDTCGMCSKKTLASMLPWSDILLYDLKEIDAVKHRAFTGSANHQIIDNLLDVCKFMQSNGRPQELWIRTPIIPGATATRENIRGIGNFIAAQLDGVISRWDLCAFNNLCRDKYARLDLDWRYKNHELLSSASMADLAEVARHSGVNSGIVHWSGATRLE